MVREQRDWEKITPAELLPAIKHIRELFDESVWKCRELTEKLCYAGLHPDTIDQDALASYKANFVIYRTILGRAAQREFDDLIRLGTSPSVFQAYFGAFQKGVGTEVLRLFNEALQMGLANSEALKMHPVEWAKVHLGILIHRQSHLVSDWTKSVCDRRDYSKRTETHEDFLEVLQWKTWRAPRLIHMKPHGNTPNDPASAWIREDDLRTQELLKALTDHFLVFLEIDLDKIAGDAHVACAKKSEPKMLSKQPPSQDEAPQRRPETESTLLRGNFTHGFSEGSISESDLWRDFHDKFMSLANEEREISQRESKDGSLRAQCTYREHPEIIAVQGKPEQGPFCLLHTPECGLWLLYGGPNENFRARFEALATRSGAKLSSPHGTEPLDFWLHRLFFDLRNNRSDELFAVSDEGGMILHVCAASATFCSRLEKNALETSASSLARYANPTHERESFVIPILTELAILRAQLEDAERDTRLWLQTDPSAEEQACVFAMQGHLADLDRILTHRIEGRTLPDEEGEWAQGVRELLSLLDRAREVRGQIVGKGLARLADRLAPHSTPGRAVESKSADRRAVPISEEDNGGNPSRRTESFTHSGDYRSVTLRGKNFTLTSRQAQVIQILDENRRNGHPDVGKDHVLEELGTPNSRLRDSFKTNLAAWKALLKAGSKKGTYRLNV